MKNKQKREKEDEARFKKKNTTPYEIKCERGIMKWKKQKVK